MNHKQQYCTFCEKLTTHYVSSKPRTSLHVICFACVTIAKQLMEKAIRIENQLSLAYFEKPKGE